MHARGQAAEWYVISLRPRGAHSGVRRAATARGAGVIALSPWALRQHGDAQARGALARALAAPCVLFTSPAAVRAACALQALPVDDGPAFLAVGAGTAAALRRAGATRVQAPARMDSEGVLALPALEAIGGSDVGLVTAPGGRGVIEPVLRSRGARVLRADVYSREAVPLRPGAVASLATLAVPGVLLLSSGEALARVLEALPSGAGASLRACAVAAASDRLQALARDSGFGCVVRAEGPRPGQLVAAAATLVARTQPRVPGAHRFR